MTAPIWPADRVERWPITKLKLFEQNARIHSDIQLDQLAASIRQWGWTMPVLCDETGTVIAGHGRILAAQRLGLDEAPVMVARGWTEAQTRAYRLADNQLGLNSGWDFDTVGTELALLRDWGFDLNLAGFDDIDALLRNVPQPGFYTDQDAIPEAPVQPITKLGDLWNLDQHRVLCGDAMKAEDVARAVDGRAINVAFTSPPYAEQREYDRTSGFEPIPPDRYVAWFKPVADNVARHLAADGSWFINIKPSVADLDTSLYVLDLVAAHVREWGWHFGTEFCWERNGIPKSVALRFKNQFEPIYQFARGRWKMRPDRVRHESDNALYAAGEGVGDTSWSGEQGKPNAKMFGAQRRRHNSTTHKLTNRQGEIGAPNAPGEFVGPGLAYPGNRLPTFMHTHTALGHPAAFPVGLPEFFCKAFADAGDLVFDPFLGTGSTLIAAEKTRCMGAGIELSPAYVDITVQRWQQFTGKTATNEKDGREFKRNDEARQAVCG